jgi:hypothetical protein
MANGPAPSPNARRRNEVDLSHLEGQDVPDRLKKLRNASTYSAYTQEWWGVWVNSPQSENFYATDWMVLQRLAMLVEAYVKRPGHNAAAEIRQQESLLGATVLDRMRLRMKPKDDGKLPDELPEDVADFMAFRKNA